MHAVQYKAAKKSILLRLLRDGSTPSLEEMMPLQTLTVHTIYHRECEAYLEFARMYEKYVLGSKLALDQFVQEHNTVFANDGTLDLVHWTLSARMRHGILALARIYKTFPLRHLVAFLETQEHDVIETLTTLTTSGTLEAHVIEQELSAELHAIPVPGGTIDMDAGNSIVHFNLQLGPNIQNMAQTLEAAWSSEKRASTSLKNDLAQLLTSPAVMSRILSLSSGTSLPEAEILEEDDGMSFDTIRT